MAEQLATHLSRLENVEGVLTRPPLRTTRGRRPASGVERALGRFAQLPVELAATRFKADYFHIADHSYAHLALLFPRNRVGVYCHDIDAFRALLPGSGASRARVLLSRLLLQGLRHARVVFHNTLAVREDILRYDLVPASRLVHATLGVAAEFLSVPDGIEPKRYLLHVGSCIPRKNIELLLQVFAAVRERNPGLELVQVGGLWTDAQRAYLEHHGLTPHVRQTRGISRDELASLYASAAVVLVPSLAEGFGLPIIEALACGAPVVASDIPVLREVGFEGVLFCSLSDTSDWTRAIEEICVKGTRASSHTRDRIRAHYTWQAHARVVADEYARASGART
ncbi:MAG TPA: glycosyltransferase family 1 protein [Polyangiaceae bacterium]|nr:glycosyltransferase family 1 protein [Polyangiaceae bacterium]